MTRVLVVDDEPQILRGLGTNLRARGYDVETAPDGERALTVAASTLPDVVILDLGLPGIDGVEVIRGLRAWTRTPIIVLSARDQERDKVEALDAGADDYVEKPFGMNELLARLRAAERRAAPSGEAAVVETGAFTVDLAAKKVTSAEGSEVHLTPTEWGLVESLVRRPGKLVSQRQLLQEVWGPRYEEETNYLRVYMAQIRRKLEPDPARPRYFITETGHGLPLRARGVKEDPMTIEGDRATNEQTGYAPRSRRRVILGYVLAVAGTAGLVAAFLPSQGRAHHAQPRLRLPGARGPDRRGGRTVARGRRLGARVPRRSTTSSSRRTTPSGSPSRRTRSCCSRSWGSPC